MKVSELLDSPEKWCQVAGARDKDGKILDDVLSPDARSWCLWGALHACYPDHSERWEKIRHLNNVLGTRKPVPFSFVYWQDLPGRTFEEVRDLILEAGV